MGVPGRLAIAAVWAAALLSFRSPGGEGQGTREDYERAANLGKLVSNKVYRDQVQPRWLPGHDRFWYRVRTGAETHEFILVDAAKGERRSLFEAARLAAALAGAGVRDARPDRLPLEDLELDPAGKRAEFRCGGKSWSCDLGTYELVPSTAPGKVAARDPVEAPRASARTGGETTVTFVNRTSAPVDLFWLDEGGRRHGYGKVPAGGRHEQHTFAGHVWWVLDAGGALLASCEARDEPLTLEVEVRPGAAPPETRPGRKSAPRGASLDGRWSAFVRDFNVFLKETATGEESALSGDGTAGDGYRGELAWSPDSKKLVAMRTVKGEDRKVQFVESSPRDQLQPRLHTIPYPKPGDRIAVEKPRLFDAVARREIPVRDDLFPNPWDLSDLRWTPDSGRFTFVYNQRGHQVLRLVSVEAVTGEARTLIEEAPKTFVDYAHKKYAHYVDETREILWMSERDGWNHLYLFDADTGRLKAQVTKGEWVVLGVDRVDEKARQVWFRAGGIRPGQDPYYVHHARVHFDGTGLGVLTEGNGTHRIEFSPDRRLFLDTWSRVDQPPVTELRRAEDGKLLVELERADWIELLRTGWGPPEPFAAKGRHGRTDIYGILIRPSRFDPAKKYPVIEEIYAGPQDFFVPKAFGLQVRQRSLAELGFVVVQIDGMGTNWRSKAFHDVCWKNLADAGFPDRIAWMKAAAEKYPSLDLSRVGVYGGSAGGQNALGALLRHGDFYKAAAADCGCHDNRMDKIWWNELWMGWPVGPHYAEQSNVTQAHRLKGKLLLTVGELDDNVDPASTMQVANALVRADRDFDLVVIPGAKHGAGESPYGRRRRMDFFVRHLLGTEPRSR
jgi:dipeptidyl aminopeptidase/acylaminoacyl peptidase